MLYTSVCQLPFFYANDSKLYRNLMMVMPTQLLAELQYIRERVVSNMDDERSYKR
mgnify:CR=1 FL=1